MTRLDRVFLERLRHYVMIVGVTFAVGVATGGLLVERAWRSPAQAAVAASDPEPLHDPAEPRPVERPGERGDATPARLGGAAGHEAAVADLKDRDLAVPVEGIEAADLRDTFFDSRGDDRAHEAVDIMAPRGTPVRAVEDGRIQKLFTSKAGGLTIYQFDPKERYCYYYAHLDRYVATLREGQVVERGDVIGYVGATGNASASAPHLHFAIFRLTPERVWWKGEPINPYAVMN